jgi:hypothetical protein
MLNRRSLMQRAIALVGVGVVEQKLPRGLAVLTPHEVEASHRLTTTGHQLLIHSCEFHRGDPMMNDPDWLEETPGGLCLFNRRLFIDHDFLTIPEDARLFMIGSRFYDVGLDVHGGHTTIIGAHFYNPPGCAVRVGSGATLDGSSLSAYYPAYSLTA